MTLTWAWCISLHFRRAEEAVFFAASESFMKFTGEELVSLM